MSTNEVYIVKVRNKINQILNIMKINLKKICCMSLFSKMFPLLLLNIGKQK